jgi:drug/metabolite transporter (DMT)-like permease
MRSRYAQGYAPLLITLAAIWGASYLFIKVGVRDFAPTTLMSLRMLIAGVALFGFLCLREGGARTAAADVNAARRPGLVLGIINGAIPFTLIAWGETHIDSGVAAIANSTVPIFLVLLAIRFRPSERAGGLQLVGIALGLVGVGVLAGVNPEGGAWAVAGTLAVVLASLSYAFGGLYGQSSVRETSGPVLATANTLIGGLLLLPFALVQWPEQTPGWKSIASLLALALLGTSFAQLILFRMLRLHGPARTSLVTYLMPGFALFYGALLLNEPITVSALAGLALILAGVALGSGLARPLRRGEEAVGPAPVP